MTKQSRTTDPRPYHFRLFRSDRDPDQIPAKITSSWVQRELTRRGDYGLKAHIHGDADAFQQDLKTNTFWTTKDKIRVIDDHTYQRYHRLQQFDSLG